MVRISHDSPRKVTTLLRLHQWAANEDGSHHLNVAGEEGLGEGWEVLGNGLGGYGSGLGGMAI